MAGLKSGPDEYIETLPQQNDAKSLLNDHRLLHVFYEEIKSGSPNEVVGTGWTEDLVILAHEAVNRRLKVLNPAYKHDSPLSEELSAAVRKGVVPLLVIPEYVSIVGGRAEGREGDLDVVVRAETIDESLQLRITQALGEDVHLIANPQGPHDEEYDAVYHLALIPIRVWNELSRKETPLVAAMDAYRHGLRMVMRDGGEVRGQILTGAARIRRDCRRLGLVEAKMLGLTMATRVLAGERIPLLEREIVASSNIDWDKVQEEAEERYEDLMRPIKSGSAFRDGLRAIGEQIRKWQDKIPFSGMDEALDAARELALKEAKSGE